MHLTRTKLFFVKFRKFWSKSKCAQAMRKFVVSGTGPVTFISLHHVRSLFSLKSMALIIQASQGRKSKKSCS